MLLPYNDLHSILNDNIMPYPTGSLYRAAQIRAVERVAIEQLDIAGLQLMRSAGLAAFDVLKQHWPRALRIAVFCGGGNNGGDGYVIARLALQAGMQVALFSVVDVEVLQGDARQAHVDFLAAGGRVQTFEGKLVATDVVIDALLGTGLARAVSDGFERAIKLINATECPILALDIPSGLHADTGQVMGCAVRADITVTFIGLKTGLFTGQAANHRGVVIAADLHVPAVAFHGITPFANLTTVTPLPRRPRDAHKGHFGHLLLVGGNLGFSGAIRLAAEAALRTGAGLVSIATHPAHAAVLNIDRPELMCHAIEHLSAFKRLLDKVTVIVVGPGLGQDGWARMLFDEVVACGKPCVLDADALNLLAHSSFKSENRLLTPHPGEAARLLKCSTAEIVLDRYLAAKQLQTQYGGVCVLKGAGSIVADATSLTVATSGNPGMACGGMGDVLAGMCGALIAQGLSIADAARSGVQLHGEAADLAASEQGERGLLASDLFPFIRRLVN